MDVHCGGFQGNDDRSDDDAGRNGDPADEQKFTRGFLYRCALERTGPDRGRESFLRSHGHAEANRPDADPRAKGGITTSDPIMAERMPALFIGHGNPMNALLVNPYTQRWASIGATLPKAEGNTFGVGPLVHRRRSRHREHRAEDDPRFRRLSSRAISGAISRAR